MPGSHVIVKANNEELPDRVFEEAGRLAGYYSKGRDNEKIEIDYLQKKNLKNSRGKEAQNTLRTTPPNREKKIRKNLPKQENAPLKNTAKLTKKLPTKTLNKQETF